MLEMETTLNVINVTEQYTEMVKMANCYVCFTIKKIVERT